MRRHRIVAVASRDPARAEEFARRWQIPLAIASYEALLARDDIDVVYVATTPDSHCDYVLRCAAAGKPVLVEKPMCTEVEQCLRVVDAAATHPGVVWGLAFGPDGDLYVTDKLKMASEVLLKKVGGYPNGSKYPNRLTAARRRSGCRS